MVKVWNGGLFGKHSYLPTESSPPTPRKVGSGRCSACVQGLDQSTQLVPLTFLCLPVGRAIKAGLAESDPFFILEENLKVRFQKGLVLSASLLYLAGIKDVSLVLSPGRLSNCPQLSIAVYIVE